MKPTLISIVTVIAGVLAAPAPAQATVGCSVNLPGANVVVSQADGDILVGSSTVVDCFVVLNNNVTVYTQGTVTDAGQPDYIFVGNDLTPVSGAVVHADVMQDGTPIPSQTAWPYENTYVTFANTTDSTLYGSADRDYIADGYKPNINLVIHGNDGDDFMDEETGVNTLFEGGNGNDEVQVNTAEGTVTLVGNDGGDTLYDQYAASNSLAATRSVATTVVIKGGRGNDKLKALRHSDVVRAGKGRDVCRIVKGVETHGCEKIVKVNR